MFRRAGLFAVGHELVLPALGVDPSAQFGVGLITLRYQAVAICGLIG